MKKVLIVDDTKNIRMLLTTCLEVEGYEVITAKNGHEALEVFNSKEIDLAFLDIKMPELSGTEVLRKIRSMGNYTPIIIMTAFATVKNAIDCTKMGAVAYLQKPFTTEKIKNVLKEVMSLDENNIKKFLSYATTLIEERKFDGAEKILKKALSVNPQLGKIYYLMGELYNKKGECDKAKKFYDAAEVFS